MDMTSIPRLELSKSLQEMPAPTPKGLQRNKLTQRLLSSMKLLKFQRSCLKIVSKLEPHQLRPRSKEPMQNFHQKGRKSGTRSRCKETLPSRSCTSSLLSSLSHSAYFTSTSRCIKRQRQTLSHQELVILTINLESLVTVERLRTLSLISQPVKWMRNSQRTTLLLEESVLS